MADLHLDRAFRGQAYAGVDGARRRQLLRRSFEWAADLVAERKPDAWTIGGDLFELEHVTTDTIAFARRQLGRAPCPVLLISGNHDYASAASPYRTAEWPTGLTLALDPVVRPVELPGGTLWGFGYSGRELEEEVLAGFSVPVGMAGPNILVAHGADLSVVARDWRCLGLLPEQVQRMGFDHALMGHIHTGSVGRWISFPGAPVALDAGEAEGLHGALWLEAEGSEVTVQSIACPVARYASLEVKVDAAGDVSELERAIAARLPRPTGEEVVLVTCNLVGRRASSLALALEPLADALAGPQLGVRLVDQTRPEVDLEELAREPNARGKALARLLIDGGDIGLGAAALLVEAFDGDLRLPS